MSKASRARSDPLVQRGRKEKSVRSVQPVRKVHRVSQAPKDCLARRVGKAHRATQVPKA